DTSLAPAGYTGTITISEPNAANQTVAVNYTLNGPPPVGCNPTGSGTGLTATVYNGVFFPPHVNQHVDPTINFDPADPIGVTYTGSGDNFSVKWDGEIEAQCTETYTFYARTDDGVRLWVNGVLLVDKWFGHPPTEYSGTIDLIAGQKYPIRMDFFEGGVTSVAQLFWSSPQTPKAIVPQSQLTPSPVGPTYTYTRAPATLNYSAVRNDPNPVSQNVTIQNTGNQTLNFTLSDDRPWMSISPTVFSVLPGANRVVSVSVTDTSLAPAGYTGTITISEPNAANQTVTVNYTVSAGLNYTFTRAPASLSYSANQGAGNPASQNVTITNTGNQDLSFIFSDDRSWISIVPAVFSVLPGANRVVSVSVTDTSLAPANYTGTVTISEPNAGNQTVAVDYTVNGVPLVGCNAAGIGTGLTATVFNGTNFNSQTNQHIDATINFNPSDPIGTTYAGGGDTFSVRWEGEIEARCTETYTFYILTDDGVRLWVNGILLIDKWFAQPPTEHTATINLIAGQKYPIRMEYFENTVFGVAQLFWSSPQTPKAIVPQSQLTPLAGAPIYTFNKAPSSLNFSAEQNGPNPASQNVTIQNTGDQNLDFTISDNRSWISVAPTTFSVAPGANRVFTVSVTDTSFAPGNYTGAVTISEPNAANQTVPVDYTVDAPPVPIPNVAVSISAVNGSGSFSLSDIKDGDILNFSITYRNDGPGDATQVKAGISASANISSITNFSCPGLCFGNYNNFTYPSILSTGEFFTVTFDATVSTLTTQPRELVIIDTFGTYDPGAIPFSARIILLAKTQTSKSPEFIEIPPE
ncbi:MAG: hypothetical protein COT91_05075, partial [Candidatus Doudnabacteria bacterium CG10_big_fil_rev_8_21_14_0_10_41_10]